MKIKTKSWEFVAKVDYHIIVEICERLFLD